MKKVYLFLFTIVFALFIQGCIDSQKVIKSTNKEYKFAMANKWYNEGKFIHVIPVIEDLLNVYKGTDTAPMLYFMLAESYFQNKEYTVAAYHYKTYKDLYSRTPQSEVASFKLAECYYHQIPPIELDQTDVDKAIDYYKSYLSEYPSGGKQSEAYQKIENLKRINETKTLMAADLYYKTKNYRAAFVTYKNVLNQYPEIPEFREIYYKIVLSNFKFAEKSILKKQPERFEATINEGTSFITRFQGTTYVDEVQQVVQKATVKLLESSLLHAKSYFPIEERPLYFKEAMSAFNTYEKDIVKRPAFLKTYLDECYYGILYSSYLIIDQEKDEIKKMNQYRLFRENYEDFKYKITENSKYQSMADELNEKVKKLINNI